MTPIIAPPCATLFYPAEVKPHREDTVLHNWNRRTRLYNKGKLR